MDVTDGGEQDTGDEGKDTERDKDMTKQTTGREQTPTGFTVLGGFENKPVQKVL